MSEIANEEQRTIAVEFGLVPPFQQQDTSWMEHSACRGVDPEAFFPGKGGRRDKNTTNAKRVCEGCEVREQCRAYALAIEQPSQRHGTWGGASPNERHQIAGTGKKTLLSE